MRPGVSYYTTIITFCFSLPFPYVSNLFYVLTLCAYVAVAVFYLSVNISLRL
jgi:hypothetical protein